MGKTLAETRLKGRMKLAKKRAKLEKKKAGAVLAQGGRGGKSQPGAVIWSLSVATFAALAFAVFLLAVGAQVPTAVAAGAAFWVGVAGLAYKFFSEKG